MDKTPATLLTAYENAAIAQILYTNHNRVALMFVGENLRIAGRVCVEVRIHKTAKTGGGMEIEWLWFEEGSVAPAGSGTQGVAVRQATAMYLVYVGTPIVEDECVCDCCKCCKQGSGCLNCICRGCDCERCCCCDGYGFRDFYSSSD